ncbi:flagellar hook-length control protein FliK [Cupriavidus sp. AU9028]|uniref:flagellar hook-length control protein FliK n=1 Tax=Cupriavidus sp. AU9028 TaxID=2871157 RepID=UPI001C963713|nr:flagellar hook-length control protein FliK [Cupriavidus sp. AU9028]MBY4898494.1 flagellar hook-length control protein FliK [Cupriavidus sp. AU9028]
MTAIHLPPGSPSGQNLDTSNLRAQLSANKLAALLPSPSATGSTVNQSHGAATQAADGSLRAGQQGHSSQPPAGSTRETLSVAARTILTLLGQGESGPLRTPAPLLPLPPTRMSNGAAQVQQALVSLVQDSGLFYESHLAQWVAGERGLASMAREPQAGIGRDAYPGGAAQPRAGQPGQGQGPTYAGPAGGAAARPGHAGAGAGYGAGPATASAPGSSPSMGVHGADIVEVLPSALPSAAAMQSASAVAGSIAALAADDAGDPAEGDAAGKPADGSADKTGAARADSGTARGGELPRALQSAAQAYQAAASDAARLSASQSALHAAAELDAGASRLEAGAARADGAPVIHPETEGVVRQQLELLATQQFRWAGEAWPGTPMQWEVSDQPEHDATNAAEQQGDGAERNWSSRLVLELPQLGTIEARLTLTPTGLETRLAVQEERIVRMLNNAQDRLRNGLVARGIDLQHFSIRRDSGLEGPR